MSVRVLNGKQTLSTTVRYRQGYAPYTNTWYPWEQILLYDLTDMSSVGHAGWGSSSSSDNGGAFYLRKQRDIHTLGKVNTSNQGRLDGSFAIGYPTAYNAPFLAYATPSNSELDAQGTTAIARTEPTRSVADVATFIGELRSDGLPRLSPATMKSVVKDARKVPKGAGSDYLNVNFGWLPFVSDLRKMARAVVGSHDIIRNYREHGKGQKIRRRYAFPTKIETATQTAANFLPMPANSQLGFGTGGISTRRQQDTWFSGAYRYYVPVADTQMEKFAVWKSNAQKLLGVDITPEVVWNVSPWSWLVDWQTNTGDVLHNIAALGRDGLVLQYGYMMCHTSYVSDRTAKFGSHGVASCISSVDIKVRRPASPYGFGVDLGGLTAKQSAILVALGLSRT